jgi:hypothetical protein
MTWWSVAAALGFGGMLAITAAIQPGRWGLRERVLARDPFCYVPTWTFFAPDPGVADARLLWRERLVDGTVGPWQEALPPPRGAWRAVWNPRKRARKAVLGCSSRMAAAGRSADDESVLLDLAYLMIVQYVVALPASPLSAARQFALVRTRGADDEDGLFELQFASRWHRLPPASSDLGPDMVGTPEPVEPAA